MVPGATTPGKSGAHSGGGDFLKALEKTRVLPLLSGEAPEKLLQAGRILVRAGFEVLEVALRTPSALEALSLLSRELPQVLLGAGTLLEASQVEEVRRAGARFVVSPGFRPALHEAARQAGLPFIPGVATPTEAMAALDEGLTLLKFFPAEALGGAPRLRATHAALGHKGLRWIPTGGIGLQNLSTYLALPWVAACGGSWLAPRNALEQGDFQALGRRAEETLALTRRSRP